MPRKFTDLSKSVKEGGGFPAASRRRAYHLGTPAGPMARQGCSSKAAAYLLLKFWTGCHNLAYTGLEPEIHLPQHSE